MIGNREEIKGETRGEVMVPENRVSPEEGEGEEGTGDVGVPGTETPTAPPAYDEEPQPPVGILVRWCPNLQSLL